MKAIKYLLFSLSLLPLGMLQALPEKAQIDFTLQNIDTALLCPEFIKDAKVRVEYDYNFATAIGWAHLKQLDSAILDEPLYPMGLSSQYGFMSNMTPQSLTTSKGELVLYRIIFNLQKNGDAKLSLMLGQEGDCIMSTNTVKVQG